LDRCSHKKAVELLSTIKTFLAQDSDRPGTDKCIFLIPCDDEAIKKHLSNVYQNDSELLDSDEFLRKFFNTSIRIPEFIDTELQTFTESLLKETKIPQFVPDEVAYVITAAFRDNPRQIKQFINTLISHFLLAQQRESGTSPEISQEGTITSNVDFLAKFLIVRQKYPPFFTKIAQDFLPPLEWEEIKIEDIEIKVRDDFIDFNNATKSISVPDIRPFIFLRQSKEELAIPGLRDIEKALLDNKTKSVIEVFERLKLTQEILSELNKFFLRLLHRHRNKRKAKYNIIECSLNSLHQKEIDLNDSFYKMIGKILNDSLKDQIPNFPPNLIFNDVLSKCRENDRNGIIDQYIEHLNNPSIKDLV